MTGYLLAFIAGYLLGTIPFGLIMTRLGGLGDIRSIGSGNIGATNVLRTGRKDLAAATVLLDAGKGIAAVLAGATFGPFGALIGGAAAVLGHCTCPWLGFRGGKGIATGFGTVLALSWPVGLLCLLIWLATAFLTRRSSAAALAALIAAPPLMLAIATPPMAIATALVSLLILARHHGNIRRLLAGTEPRIGS